MKIQPILFGLMVSCGIATAQPLLHYTFDEASGNALDYGSGTASPGTLQGGAVRSSNTPSGIGSSIDFRGEPPYAHVLGEDAAKLDGLNQLTLSTWLNVESYLSGNHRLVAKQAAGTFGGFNFSMNATPNDGSVGADNFRLGMFIGNNISSGAGNFAAVFSTADVDAANKWVFLAVTYDATAANENLRFYIGDQNNGVSQLGNALTVAQITLDGGAARFGVGFTDAAPTSDTSVIGYQDDVRVYGSALDLATLDTIRLEAVPEPSTYALIGTGLAALFGIRRMRKS